MVALHHALRTDVLESVPTRLVHADDFLRDGLSSFEIAELEVWEARRAAGAERERVEILDSLSAAHLAILAVPGLRPRLEIACERAMALVGGQRARIELGASEWGGRRVATSDRAGDETDAGRLVMIEGVASGGREQAR